MQDYFKINLKKLKEIRVRRRRMLAVVIVLSLLVSMNVFWSLRQPGLTLAGDADCGLTEHTHDELCDNDKKPCNFAEHTHNIECYIDVTADVEAQADWQEMFENYPYTGNLSDDLVGVAKTQVGYSESRLNFEISEDGTRHGYTRYGAWYGTPYSSWSATFVSFCLHYAGADADEFAINTGADSMAEKWKRTGRYASVGEYTPASGDLVFFNDNTVGIISEVNSTTINVICGDKKDTVENIVIPLIDSSIVGWGLINRHTTQNNTDETDSKGNTQDESDETATQEVSQNKSDGSVTQKELLDISDGPAVFIFQGGDTAPKMKRFSMRSSQETKELIPYLEENGGSYFFTLLDKNNQELPKDDNGNYIAQANTGYKLTLSFNSPEGFLPGTYQYQIPNGLMVDGGEGVFILSDGTNVGNWEVTDTGLITLIFNDNINSRSDITISATLGIHFPEQEDPIDFDGKITVSIEKAPAQAYPTVVNKWGNQGGVAGSSGVDPGKIYWGLEIVGNKDSQIPGSILKDSVIDGEWSKIHRFTESDIAGGLTFGVAENGNWHSWHVEGDDPHLIWTETGWTYKMPKTAICQWCGEIELGNEGWYYYIDYSSTPDPAGTAGTFGYENEATIDGAYGYSWVNFTHGEATGEILKNGSFTSDAGGGGFKWEFKAIIPGRQEGKKADYHWYIMDNMKLLDSSGQVVSLVENDAHLATVTATYNDGTTIQVPRVQDATKDDMFAWDNGWSSTEDGITYGREFNLLCRCRCTNDTCHWGGGCGEYWYKKDDGTYATNGFCQCWTVSENVTFTFVYETNDLSVIENYGGYGYQVQNVAELYYIPEGAVGGALVSRSDAEVPVPGLFKKELTHDFDGYTANYKVTVNEAKVVLTDGSPLTIHDVMTDTLAYISGSLVITAEDADGNITTLQQGVDYQVSYDGTGNQTDEKGNEVHVLDIEIYRPQPVMYTLNYDATLVLPKVVSGGVKYTNSATITLWGESVTNHTAEKVYADINIAAKSYKVELLKISDLTGVPLGGATFGLYNEQGGLIATDITDDAGKLMFQTNVIEGVILREHQLYYMQELRAPPGYQLDDTKYWFCFCDETGKTCEICDEVLADTNGFRIPFEQIGKVMATNQLMNYDLPATGGPGVYPLILVSVLFIATPLVYLFIRRRKRERRDVG